MEDRDLVPPDGGWGWVIVVAYALFNFLIIPVLQNFGLIFQGKFKELGLSATDESFVVTSGLAIGMIAGLGYGPLIKRFNYRVVCAASALFTSVGIVSMMFASRVYHFLLCYGIVTSIGLSLGMTGYTYALNSYFLKRRSFATGFAFTITCIGSIAMPQMISYLLYEYGVSGTCLLIGGMSLNSFVSASLLQPVDWHLKLDTTIFHKERKFSRRASIFTISVEDLPSQHPDSLARARLEAALQKRIEEEAKKTPMKRCMDNFAHMFDLSLLRDKSFLNLLIGISIGGFAEQSFSVLTPFILADLGMTTQEIATFISVLSLTDLTFRFITPFVGTYYKVTSKAMCMVSFNLLIVSRSLLLLPLGSYSVVLLVALAIGVAKGVRTVYWSLVIPDYVPLKKLPSATGFNMVLNGVFLLLGGPVLGVAKQLTGSYVNCVYITNGITLISLIMWSVEMLYKRYKAAKKVKDEDTKL